MAKAFGQLFFFRILGMVASILTVSLTIRYLGGTDYGYLTTAIMFVSLWTSLTELGIGAVIVRRVTAGHGDLGELVRVNTAISLVYCLPLTLVAVATGAVIYRDSPDTVRLLPVIGLTLALTTVTSCLMPVFLTTVRFGAVAMSDFFGRALSLGLTVALIHTDAGLWWFAFVQLVPLLVVVIVQGWAASRVVSLRPNLDWTRGWDLIKESLPQTGVLIIGVLYWRIDGVLLSLLDTPREVAIYYLAYTVAFTLSIVPTFFQTSTLSTMTTLFAEAIDEFTAFSKRSTEAMLFVGLPIAAVGWVAADGIIEAIGSERFVPRGGPTLALLLIAVGITFLNGSLSQALFAAHHQTFLLKLNVVNLAINIALNIAFIQWWGAIGAAIALLVSETIGLVVASWKLSDITPYRHPWVFTARLCIPTACAAVLAEALQLAGSPFWLALGAAVVVYLAINAVIGPVRVASIRSMLQRGDESYA